MKKEEIRPEDFENLNKLIKNVTGTIESMPETDKTLDLTKRFIGDLGEAIALTRIYDILGENYLYEWRGRKKKGRDLVLKSKKIEKTCSIQVKATTEESCKFVVGTISLGVQAVDILKEIDRAKASKAGFNHILDLISKFVDSKETNVWVIVHVKIEEPENPEFYWFSKYKLKKIIQNHIEKDFNMDHNSSKSKKPYNYGISKGQMTIRIGDKKFDKDLINSAKLPKEEIKRLLLSSFE